MKLWQKEFQIDKAIEHFTVGRDREMDLFLAPYDILGSLAHAQMLASAGLLNTEELEQLKEGLIHIYKQIEGKAFAIEPGVEDVHSQVEKILTEKYGEAGKKIHTGRSRNDQVLVDLRLYFRAEIEAIAEAGKNLFDTLIQLSERHKEVLMPGYTHFQVAMVSSFGLWFGAYAEALTDDMQQLLSSYRMINQNPLGSAAGYGSSFPLNRQMTTDLLGFDRLCYNAIYAQMGRGKSELVLSFAMAALAHTLGKLAMDICMYINQNYDFIRLPDALTTGSSIMPHKKNPDVFELIRAKCNKILALPQEISIITSNLPAGYHRDFQLLKESLFTAIQELKSCLAIAAYALSKIEIKENLLNDEKYKYLFSVEAVNREVLLGLPFRDAYNKIGRQIENGTFEPGTSIQHSHEGSIGNLCNEQIQKKMQQVLEAFNFSYIHDKLKSLLQ